MISLRLKHCASARGTHRRHTEIKHRQQMTAGKKRGPSFSGHLQPRLVSEQGTGILTFKQSKHPFTQKSWGTIRITNILLSQELLHSLHFLRVPEIFSRVSIIPAHSEIGIISPFLQIGKQKSKVTRPKLGNPQFKPLDLKSVRFAGHYRDGGLPMYLLLDVSLVQMERLKWKGCSRGVGWVQRTKIKLPRGLQE